MFHLNHLKYFDSLYLERDEKEEGEKKRGNNNLISKRGEGRKKRNAFLLLFKL